MEENIKKTKRSSNFTKVEEMLLVEEVEKFKSIIECKMTDKVNNHDKSQAWIELASQFNAKGPSQQARSVEQLRAKYENLKTKARKFAAENRKCLQSTGGGPYCNPDRDPVIEAILRIINEKTVIGLKMPNDSDAVDFLADEVLHQVTENEEFIILNEEIEEEKKTQSPIELVTTQKGIQTVVINTNNEETDMGTPSGTDWSRYKVKQLRTPVSQKLRQKVPISNSLQIAKEEYYRKKTTLLEHEIQAKKSEEEDRRRKREREEEEHEIKMKILILELKEKEAYKK